MIRNSKSFASLGSGDRQTNRWAIEIPDDDGRKPESSPLKNCRAVCHDILQYSVRVLDTLASFRPRGQKTQPNGKTKLWLSAVLKPIFDRLTGEFEPSDGRCPPMGGNSLRLGSEAQLSHQYIISIGRFTTSLPHVGGFVAVSLLHYSPIR